MARPLHSVRLQIPLRRYVVPQISIPERHSGSMDVPRRRARCLYVLAGIALRHRSIAYDGSFIAAVNEQLIFLTRLASLEGRLVPGRGSEFRGSHVAVARYSQIRQYQLIEGLFRQSGLPGPLWRDADYGSHARISQI